MNRTLTVLVVSALLLAACGPGEPPAVVEADSEARAAETATAKERLAAIYAANPEIAAACAAADTIVYDLLADRFDETEIVARLRVVYDGARGTDDPLLAARARDALAAATQERHGAVGYHLGSVQIVCDHYRDDLS